MNLDAKFNHKLTEDGMYKSWLEKEVFKADTNSNKEKFSILLPPPNVTGKLHLGHAWDGTLQDILIRYKKMQGYEAMWLAGMDHAGIATQSKVEERLIKQGTNKHELGREKFIDKTWEWKEEYAQIIRSQWEKMGFALDYSQETFTMDQNVNDGVNKVFKELYEKEFIYQGNRITNWDPVAKTAISDIEVIYQEVVGNEHYFKYVNANDPSKYVEVMTTRPETMFGDAALAVHPNDKRYKDIVGKMFIIPNTEIKIPIIQDEYVDMEKGSGVVKITKAHDVNDYEVALRHNLETRIVIGLDGTMEKNEFVPEKFQGLDRFEARKLQVEEARENGTLIKVNEIVHNVGHSERSGAIIEPLLSRQWYVKMDKLAQEAIEYQKKDGIKFYPQRFENTYLSWMEDIQDWCISRQLWWGHQIPVWYHNQTNEIVVGEKPVDIENYIQDEDVLDTWFSSALWPLVTTIWKNEGLKEFFPSNVLVTGYDIIFFWVSRMIFQTIEFEDKKPFNDVLIHGLIRAEDGKKMSKSLGNGIDPMDVIEKYGVDALRLFLMTNSSPGQDLRYSDQKLEASWNFINKLWNISRFVLMNIDTAKELDILNYQELFDVADHFIIDELNQTIKHVNTMMDKYEFGEVGRSLNEFIRNNFADWYVEIAKINLNGTDEKLKEKTQAILSHVLKDIIKLLHPFMPFVTEKIYTEIKKVDALILEEWPEVVGIKTDFEAKKEFVIIQQVITDIRNVRANNDIKPSLNLDIKIEANERLNKESEEILEKIARVTLKEYVGNLPKDEVISLVHNKFTIHILSKGVINNDEKINKLENELNKIKNEIVRSNGMLSNEKFINKAPQQKLEEEVSKALTYIEKFEEIIRLLNEFDVDVKKDEKIVSSIEKIIEVKNDKL